MKCPNCFGTGYVAFMVAPDDTDVEKCAECNGGEIVGCWSCMPDKFPCHDNGEMCETCKQNAEPQGDQEGD